MSATPASPLAEHRGHWFYWAWRLAMGVGLRLFYRVRPPVDPHGALARRGPVIYVANHPNGLIDPALLFVLARRHVTFLGKAPLFTVPVLGAVFRLMGALPVYRRSDGFSTDRNEATLQTSARALTEGRAITIFPEGISHSHPQLQALKTGCARIALAAAQEGAAVSIVPVGFTYQAKTRFRSEVHVEVGPPLAVGDVVKAVDPRSVEDVEALTLAIFEALHRVTLNLERWEDLPLIHTALALSRWGAELPEVERTRAFARGVAELRRTRPERHAALTQRVRELSESLEEAGLSAADLSRRYSPRGVALFVVRNLLWLAALPLFVVGMVALWIPYHVPAWVARRVKADEDTESTYTFLTAMLVVPSVLVAAAILGAMGGGAVGAVTAVAAVAGVGLFTRVFYERRTRAWRELAIFFTVSFGPARRRALADEARAVGREIDAVVSEVEGGGSLPLSGTPAR